MTGDVGLSFGYNGAGQSIFNLADFNKVRVVVRGDEVGVRLKHAGLGLRVATDTVGSVGSSWVPLRSVFETRHMFHTIGKHSVCHSAYWARIYLYSAV